MNKMKLVFSIGYDSFVYKAGEVEFNQRYVGELQLLNLLERELGIYRIYKTDKDRIALYSECLKANKSNSFFEKSVLSDGLSTAKQLLLYRDELVLLGWDSLREDQPKRFKDLATVEKDFIKTAGFEGISDRWQIVIKNLTDNKIKEFGIYTILVVNDKGDLPKHIQTVFAKMAKLVTYNSITLKTEDSNSNLDRFKTQLFNSLYQLEDKSNIALHSLENDKSLQLLSFKSEQLLLDCMAAHANSDTVFVNQDNANFDYSLVSLGKTATGSKQIQANPQLIQIVKLIIPCFSAELNLQTLISFLTLSYCPLDFLLTKELSKQLSKKPGVNNKEWNSIIDCYLGVTLEKEKLNDTEEKLIKHFKTNDISEEVLKERKKQVKLFLTFNTPFDEGSKKGERIIKELKKWAEDKKKTQSISELKEQFTYIEQFCKNIIDNFDFKTGSALELEQMIKSFYEVKNFNNYYKQQKSVNVIDDINLIVQTTTKEVYWLDFDSEKVKTTNQFLLKEEIDFLTSNNWYNTPEKAIDLQLKQWLNGIVNCNTKLVLCRVKEAVKEKHPLHIRLESFYGKSVNQLTTPIDSLDDFIKHFKVDKNCLIESKNISLPLAQSYLETEVLKTVEKRDVESASSIEKFIQYPFDWVMQYVAKFSNNVGMSLPNENLLKGNVAHKTIEKLLEEHKDLKFEDIDIEKIFMGVIEAEAAIFMQPEKRFDLSEFKYRFFKSFKNLIEIIKLNNFTIKALEYQFGKEQNCVVDELLGSVTGSIDLYLIDETNNPFIVDLKWSNSDKKYTEKIEENEAIQLAIYTAAIKERDLANTAYFMLNQNKLITAVKNLKGNNISVIDVQINNQGILDKIKKSLEFRWSELKQGRLEIGDDVSLKGLQYMGESGLISLPEGNKKVKKAYPYSGYKLFKGMLK